MKRAAALLPLLFACAHQVTATGLKECYTTFYVVGWYHGCGEGPSWDQQVENPHAVRVARTEVEQGPPRPARFYCFTAVSDDLLSACASTMAECKQERDRLTVPDLSPCSGANAAWCFGDQCEPTKSSCVAQRAQAGGGAAECTESK